jgi:uncharacterized lipoprotein
MTYRIVTYRIALIAIMAASTGLTGCKHLRQLAGSCRENRPYMRAQSIAPLKIPAGFDTPDTTNALHIPALNTPDPPPRKKTDPCLDEPPPFNVPKKAPPQA